MQTTWPVDLRMESIKVILSWPPSVNHYWRRNGNRYFISQKGKDYRDEVYLMCLRNPSNFNASDRLCVHIDAYPPDKRRRDIDNVLKSLLDAFQHAGVYEDDNQIDSLSIVRKMPLNGQVVVTINRIVMH